MLKYFKCVLGILVVTAVMLSTTGCVARAYGLKEKPPIIKVELRPPCWPYRRAKWIPGHGRKRGKWVRKRGKWVRRRGHWSKPRRRKIWIPAHCSHDTCGWICFSGGWR